MQALRDLHRLVDEKRSSFWAAKVSEQANARSTWRTINNILCRHEPVTSSTTLNADSFAKFFAKIIDGIRAATDGAPAASFRESSSNTVFPSFQ